RRLARAGARGGDELELVRRCEVPVAADVAVLPADHEHDEILVADACDSTRRRRIHVHDAARLELERVARHFEARASAVHEVELVLLVVEVRAAHGAGGQHERVHTEGGDPKLAAHLAEDAVAHLVDRTVRMAHGYHHQTPCRSKSIYASLSSSPPPAL